MVTPCVEMYVCNGRHVVMQGCRWALVPLRLDGPSIQLTLNKAALTVNLR